MYITHGTPNGLHIAIKGPLAPQQPDWTRRECIIRFTI